MGAGTGRCRDRRRDKFYHGLTAAFEAYAVSQFELSAIQDDGKPLREHLLSIQRQTGKTPAALANAPSLPVELGQLWADFVDLHSSRGSTGFGPARIMFSDIDAWMRVTGNRLAAWQIAAIRKADDAFMASLPAPKAAA